MCERKVQEKLYSLCFIQLVEIRSTLERKVQEGFSKEEIRAQLEIVNALFGLAAGAAVRLEMEPRDSDIIVRLVDGIADMLNWNASSQQ